MQNWLARAKFLFPRAAIEPRRHWAGRRVAAFLLCGLVTDGLAWAQSEPDQPVPGVAANTAAATGCLAPPPLVNWEDYRGPFQKVVGTVGQRLDRRSAHLPHYKAGVMLCSLDVKGKFLLFVNDAIDPLAFVTAGFAAGIDQATNRDPSFGQGAAGYGHRFGTGFAGQASVGFFTEFVYPAVFREDPRYYRLAQGSTRERFLHAVEHTVVAHGDNGRRTFNSSEWLGTSSAAILNNTMHPDYSHGLGAVAQSTVFSILEDMGFDVLREFWPEVARKLKMPFRDRSEP